MLAIAFQRKEERNLEKKFSNFVITCYDQWVLQSFAKTDSKFFLTIIEQKSFLSLDTLYPQKRYINAECYCKHELWNSHRLCSTNTFTTWLALFFGHLDIIFFSLTSAIILVYFTHLFLLSVHLYLFPMFATRSGTSPVDTGRKLNVHETFRRRAGSLLNVLCTFNLRPVSTGLSAIPSNTFIFNWTTDVRPCNFLL